MSSINHDFNTAVFESNKNWTTFIDEVNDSITYIGTAEIGTTSDSPFWQIRKITKTGTQTLVQWAESTDRFSNVWDDRATFTYS
jgi:hypothetical protein